MNIHEAFKLTLLCDELGLNIKVCKSKFTTELYVKVENYKHFLVNTFESSEAEYFVRGFALGMFNIGWCEIELDYFYYHGQRIPFYEVNCA